MKKVYLYIIIFSLFPSFKSQSQDYIGGYIVKTNGDSLNGFIVNSSQKVMTKKIIFKIDLTQKSQEYSSSELIRFGIGKEKYISGKIEDEPCFLQLLVSGHLSLYSTYLKGLRYFVKKGDFFIKLSRESYVETLAKYCSDCKRLDFSDATTFEKIYPFQSQGIGQFVYNYNLWMFSEYPVEPQKYVGSNRMKSKYGVFVGIESQSMGFKMKTPISDSEQKNVGGGLSPVFGIMYQQGITSAVAIKAELMYSSVGIKYIERDVFDKVEWENNYKAKIIRLPISIVYVFRRGKRLNPFLNLGYQFMYKMSEEPNFFIKTSRVSFATGNVWHGFLFGAGCDYTLGKRTAFIQLRLTNDSMIDAKSKATSRAILQSFQVTGGIKF